MSLRWPGVRRKSLRCVALLLLGCAKEPKHLSPQEGCKTPEVATCFAQYAHEWLSDRDIERMATEGLSRCLAADKQTLHEQSACLPLEMGTDNLGRAIIIGYFYSDNGPGHAYVGFAKNMNLEECCGWGEIAYRDFAWGGYGGCRSRVAIAARYPERDRDRPYPSLCNARER